jgi:hypothetical protein
MVRLTNAQNTAQMQLISVFYDFKLELTHQKDVGEILQTSTEIL